MKTSGSSEWRIRQCDSTGARAAVLIACLCIGSSLGLADSDASAPISGRAGESAVRPAHPGQMEWCQTHLRWPRKEVAGWAAALVCPQVGDCDSPTVRDSWIPDASTPIVTIRMAVNVFAEDDGSNQAATQADVDAQLAQLNSDYLPSRIQFTATTNFINDSRYRDFSNDEHADMKAVHADSPESQINLYIVNILAGFAGWATPPWSSVATHPFGGLMIDDGAFGAGQKTVTHEIGHCLGLMHTHRGVSEVDACDECWERADGIDGDITGDFASDTAPTPMNYGCGPPGGTDDCSSTMWGQTDPQNYMGYAPDSCYTEFSAQQDGRQHCWANAELSGWIVDPEGACCQGSDCTVETEQNCLGLPGIYLGDGTNCGTGSGDPTDIAARRNPCDVECWIDLDCADSLYCNGEETCMGGECWSGTQVACDDGVACTHDSCIEATDSCEHVADEAYCDNDLLCDGVETCDPVLDCQVGTAVDCNDGVGCTDDSCNDDTDSCDNIGSDPYCDNGLFCDGAETCDPGFGCRTGADPCPTKICDEDNNQCVSCQGDPNCDDGLSCNGSETCVAGSCQPGTAVDCNDPNCYGDPVCCDDGLCDPLENQCTCPLDCGTPPPTETGLCSDELDNDCDGCVNSADSDCNGVESDCADGWDDDCDGLVDCADIDCDTSAVCCPLVAAPALPTTPTHASGAKNRYLSFVPRDPGKTTALRVTLTASTEFPGAVGSSWWVGSPITYCESAAHILPPSEGCGPAPGIPSPTFLSSDLQCSRHCMDWGSLGDVIHVGDVNVTPNGTYTIEAIDCACNGISAGLPIETTRWGDALGSCSTCPCDEPDTVVNITTDVTGVLNKFKNLPCAIIKVRADLEPAVPDRQINIGDVTASLNGFRGFEYTFPEPEGCP